MQKSWLKKTEDSLEKLLFFWNMYRRLLSQVVTICIEYQTNWYMTSSYSHLWVEWEFPPVWQPYWVKKVVPHVTFMAHCSQPMPPASMLVGRLAPLLCQKVGNVVFWVAPGSWTQLNLPQFLAEIVIIPGMPVMGRQCLAIERTFNSQQWSVQIQIQNLYCINNHHVWNTTEAILTMWATLHYTTGSSWEASLNNGVYICIKMVQYWDNPNFLGSWAILCELLN